MKPLKLAIVGCGKRSRTVYGCFLKRLADQIEVVAVCDPVKAAADDAAAFYGARAYYSIRDLVADRPMEAALLVTPEESHHALSVFLSRHGVHHACETPMASTLIQARAMEREAAKAGVVLHVNEQFFRRDVLAFSRQIIAAGAIGQVGRAVIHGGHGGPHDNSILMAYAGPQRPVAVNAIEHVMPVERHKELYNRWFEEEHYVMRAIQFSDGFLGVSTAANQKGALGRQPRPGYLEVQGSRGTFVENGVRAEWPWLSTAEVRIVSDADRQEFSYAKRYPLHAILSTAPHATCSLEIPYHGDLVSLGVDLPGGQMTHANPTLGQGILDNYLSSVALATLDFVRAVQTGAPREFSTADALTAMELEAGFHLSAARDGARIELPLAGDPAVDIEAHEVLRKKHGRDPLDVEAMIDLAYPKTYVG